MKKLHYIVLILLLFAGIVLSDDPHVISNTSETDEASLVTFNRIQLQVNDNGLLGRDVPTWWSGECMLDTNVFMRTSGFFLNGINQSGEVWANGIQPRFRVNDYLKGTIDINDNDDESLYYISRQSPHFGLSWNNWKNAVELGAEFYDGDNDGNYVPVDKNGNGVWDPNEDRPAMYGDVMTWTVFNDGVPAADRRTKTVEPQGIEIRQTVWAYKRQALEKVIFVKYSILNTGGYSETLDSVVFSLCVDSELGARGNDYVGSDVRLNSGYTYYLDQDYLLNDLSLSLVTSLVQGPLFETGYSEDEAYRLNGDEFIEEKITGSINQPMTSFYKLFSSFPTGNVNSLRWALLNGNEIDPCNDFYGDVFSENCDSVDSKFMYSGNLFKKEGWINTRIDNQIYIQNTGEFKLEAGKSVDIIFAYIVGTGEDGYTALQDGLEINKNIKSLYFEQPVPPPSVNPITISDDKSIELVWETYPFFDYSSKGYGYDLEFEGFEVYMHKTNSTLKEIGGSENSLLIGRYDISNNIDKILVEDNKDYNLEVVYKDGMQLDIKSYSDPDKGRILLRIDRDHFTNEPLIKGKPYYFSISTIAVDKNSLERYGPRGTYLVPHNAQYGIEYSSPMIINDNKGNEGIVVGENLNDPFVKGYPLEHVSGNSNALVTYSVYDRTKVKDDLYELGFVKKDSEFYELNYYIRNLTTGEYFSDEYEMSEGTTNIQNLTDGFTVDINWITPGIKDVTFEGEEKWFKDFDGQNTGVYYVGKDLDNITKLYPVTDRLSNASSAENLGKVEIHFGDTSKAYRYVRKAVRYMWNGTAVSDSGFVDIPLSAYEISINGDVRQLSIGFLENAFINDTLKYPDGRWNPGTSIQDTKEYLIIFSSEYNEDYSARPAYTGYEGEWADIAHGTWLHPDDTTLNDSLKTILGSAWFDAMYVVGFETDVYNPVFSPTGKLIIEPYGALTSRDKYVFRVKKDNSEDELRAQFDKVNVYPNPLFGNNSSSESFGYSSDEPFVTFSHLPPEVNIKIYTLSGTLIRELYKNDMSSLLRWDLQNESGRRAASGFYIALVESPELGQKILKFSIIMPQKQVHFR